MDDATMQVPDTGRPEKTLTAAVRALREGGSLAVRRTDDDTLVALFRRRGATTTQVRVMNLGGLPPHVPAGCPCRTATCGRTRVDGPADSELVGGIGCAQHATDWCVWLVALHHRRCPGEDLWVTAVSPDGPACTILLPTDTVPVTTAVPPASRLPRQVRSSKAPACLSMEPKVRVLPPREKPRDERYYLWGWATDSK